MKIVNIAKQDALKNIEEHGYAEPALIIETVKNKVYVISISEIIAPDVPGQVMRAVLQETLEKLSGYAYALVLHTHKDDIVISYQNMLSREYKTWISKRGERWELVRNSGGPMAKLFDNPGDILL